MIEKTGNRPLSVESLREIREGKYVRISGVTQIAGPADGHADIAYRQWSANRNYENEIDKNGDAGDYEAHPEAVPPYVEIHGMSRGLRTGYKDEQKNKTIQIWKSQLPGWDVRWNK